MGKQKKDRKKAAQKKSYEKQKSSYFKNIKEKLNKLSKKSGQSEKTQKRLGEKTDALEKGQSHLEADIQKLRRKTARLKEQTREIHLENGRIIEKLTTEIDETYVARTRLNRCEADIRANRQRLDTITRQLKEIEALRSGFEAIDARIQQRLAGIPERPAAPAAAPPPVTETPESDLPARPAEAMAATSTGGVERIMGRAHDESSLTPAASRQLPAVGPAATPAPAEAEEAGAAPGAPGPEQAGPATGDAVPAAVQDESEDFALAIAQLFEEQSRQEQRTDRLDRLLEELRGDGSAVADLIRSLDVKLDDTAAQTDALVPQVADLAADLKALTGQAQERLLSDADRLQSRIDELEKALALQKGEFAEGLAGVQQGLEEQQSRAEVLERRLDDGSRDSGEAIAALKRGMEARLAKTEGFDRQLTLQKGEFAEGLAALQRDLDDQQSSVEEALGENRAGLARVEKRLDQTLAEQGEQLGLVNRQAGEQRARHNRLAGAFWALAAAVVILGGALYWQNRAQIDALGSRLLAATSQPAAGDEERFGQLEAELARWRTALESQDGRLAEQRELIAGLSDLVTAQRDAIDGQAGRMESQEAMLRKQATRLSGLSEAVEAQSMRVGTIERNTTETAARLTELDERQAALAEALEVIRTERPPPPEPVRPAGGTDARASGAVELRGAEWLQSLPDGHYTIQLLGAFHPRYIQQVADASGLELPMAHYEKTHEGRPWHVLLYGDFGTRASAEAALEGLPEALRAAGPWVRRLSAVQSDLRHTP